MKNLFKKLSRWFKPAPDMLDLCKCGHPFEEHDWGAYRNLRTRYSSACIVEACTGYEDKLVCWDFQKVKEKGLDGVK